MIEQRKNNDLELAFHQRMLQIYDQAKSECKYNAISFLQMIGEHGGLEAAKQLLITDGYSDGLARLCMEKRLDISMEATILRDPWCQLFSDEELKIARKILVELGYFGNNENG